METIQVTVPKSVTVDIKYHGAKVLDLSDKSPDWFGWVIEFGSRQSSGDGDAGKANTPEGKKAVLEKWTRIAAGEIPAGGGGGGARLADEDKATLLWLRQNNPKGTYVGKELPNYWRDITREKLKEAYKALGKTDKEIGAIVNSDDWVDKLEANIPKVKASYFAQDESLKKLVESVKSERLSKKAPPKRVEVAVSDLSL